MLEVTLTWSEVMQAAQVGVLRQVQNLRLQREPRYGAGDAGGWEKNIVGTLGEMAVAKWLNQFWSGALGDLKAADVGLLQIRATVHGTHLLLHPADADEQIFILVTGLPPVLRLCGWCRGREGKQQRYWRDLAGGRPAYCVPQAALRAMAQISRLRAEEKFAPVSPGPAVPAAPRAPLVAVPLQRKLFRS